MSEFIISGISKSGKIEKQNITATSAENAIDLCSFKKDKIIKVNKDYFHMMKEILRFKPKIDNQILLLSSLAAMSESGQNVRDVLFVMLKTYVKEYEVRDVSIFDEVYKLSDILKQLNFETSAITLVQAGERTGDVGKMLDTAAQTLQEQQEISKRANAGLKGSLILMSFALTLLILLPLSLGEIIQDILSQPDIHLTTNGLTDFFVYMSYFLNEYWVIILSVIAASFYFRKQIWVKIRGLFLIRAIWELQKINRSIYFLNSYKPFVLSGIDSLTTMGIIAQNVKGESGEIFTKVAKDLKKGTSISKAIDNDNFVYLLRVGFGSFEKTTAKSQVKVMKSLERSLVNINEIYATRISGFVKGLSMFITAALVIMLFIGIILPLQSITPS